MQRANYARGLRFLPVVAFITTVGFISANAQSVYTDPVGFISYTAVPTGLSDWGLAMTPIPVLRGQIGTLAHPGQIPVNSTLTANQFTADGTAGHIGYFIEDVSNPTYAGLLEDIVSNDTAAVYTPTDITSYITAGDSFKIYPHWTPNSVLGAPAQSDLLGGTTSANSDNVFVWNPLTQSSATYWYRTLTTGAGQGWRGPQGTTTPAGTNVIALGSFLNIHRYQDGPFNWTPQQPY